MTNQFHEYSAQTRGTFGEWSHALYTAILAGRRGREVLLKYIGKIENIEKKFQAGLVSEADKESEKVIFEILKKDFPNDEFLGEESSAVETKVQLSPLDSKSQKGRWVVDPLDGTTNFIHQFPVFCVSIGYEVAGQTQVAVIDVPMMGEVYTAVRGHGAFVNGRPLKVSSTQTLKDSFIATGFFNEVESRLNEQLKIFDKLVRETRAIRRAGAAAYDLCLVARGVFDGYWEKGLQPWDSSAGILLVEEAGGKVLTYRGQKYNPYKNTIVAGNSQIVDQLVKSMSALIAEDSQ